MSKASSGYDLVIRGGLLVDGTGAPGYRGDLAIADGKIAAIGGKIDALGADTFRREVFRFFWPATDPAPQRRSLRGGVEDF